MEGKERKGLEGGALNWKDVVSKRRKENGWFRQVRRFEGLGTCRISSEYTFGIDLDSDPSLATIHMGSHLG